MLYWRVRGKFYYCLRLRVKKPLQMLSFLPLNCLRLNAFCGRRQPSVCGGRLWHKRCNIWLVRSGRGSLFHRRRSGVIPSDAGFPVPDPVLQVGQHNGNACRLSRRKCLGDKYHPAGSILPLRSCNISSKAVGRCVPVLGSGERGIHPAFARWVEISRNHSTFCSASLVMSLALAG